MATPCEQSDISSPRRYHVVVMSSPPRRHIVAILSLFRRHLCHGAVVTNRMTKKHISLVDYFDATNCDRRSAKSKNDLFFLISFKYPCRTCWQGAGLMQRKARVLHPSYKSCGSSCNEINGGAYHTGPPLATCHRLAPGTREIKSCTRHV